MEEVAFEIGVRRGWSPDFPFCWGWDTWSEWPGTAEVFMTLAMASARMSVRPQHLICEEGSEVLISGLL